MIRAIEGQREWRGLVDRLADHWIEANRRSDDPLQLSRSDGDEAAVVVAALQKLWAAKGWPRRDMTRVHWLRLASTLLGDDRVRLTLPAGIDVDARGDVILLSRPKESKDHSSGSIE